MASALKMGTPEVTIHQPSRGVKREQAAAAAGAASGGGGGGGDAGKRRRTQQQEKGRPLFQSVPACPTYHPTALEFAEPLEYIAKIREEAER
jgi:hypothetical protein